MNLPSDRHLHNRGSIPLFCVTFGGVFRLFFARYRLLTASLGTPLSKSLPGLLRLFLLPSSCFGCPGCPAAFSQIVRTADQFCPKALHAAMCAASADMVELPASRCRIDKEVPVQFVSLGHSRHRFTSFLPETVSAQKSLLFLLRIGIRSLPGSLTPASHRSADSPRPGNAVSSSDGRYSVVKVRMPEKKFFQNPDIFFGPGTKKRTVPIGTKGGQDPPFTVSDQYDA